MKKILFALFASSLFWTGCYDHFKTTYENIVGTYHYDGDWQDRIDLYTLEILPDSTFIEKYRRNPEDNIQVHKGEIILMGFDIDFKPWLDMACFYCDESDLKSRQMYYSTYFLNKNMIDFSPDPDMREHFFVRDVPL